MARVRVFTERGPLRVEFERPVHLCMCGLSKRFPICDGSHKTLPDEEEGRVYCYDENGRSEIRDLKADD